MLGEQLQGARTGHRSFPGPQSPPVQVAALQRVRTAAEVLATGLAHTTRDGRRAKYKDIRAGGAGEASWHRASLRPPARETWGIGMFSAAAPFFHSGVTGLAGRSACFIGGKRCWGPSSSGAACPSGDVPSPAWPQHVHRMHPQMPVPSSSPIAHTQTHTHSQTCVHMHSWTRGHSWTHTAPRPSHPGPTTLPSQALGAHAPPHAPHSPSPSPPTAFWGNKSTI